jgi:GTP-binding protein
MPLPIVAIVGRPNVGKSSLLNCLARRRVAIVEPTAGVTRDRVSAVLEHGGRWFEAVDTGGMGLQTGDALARDVHRQIARAIQEAAVIVLVTDVRDGLVPLDREAAERLRRVPVPVLVAANKADTNRLAAEAAEFHALGYEPVLATSARHSRGRRDLLDAIAGFLPRESAEAPAQVAMKIAVVGKRNAGKSTFVNALAREERVIVSETPGTTRDAVDVRFEKDGLVYVAIDTAGIRRRKSLSGDIEFYGLTRALAAIRRADVVLFLIDAAVPISRVDKRLGAEIEQAMKPVVLVVNKWDLAKGRAGADDYAEYLTRSLPGLSYAPLAFTTATDSRNVAGTIDLARSLWKQATTRVPTSRLNACLEAALGARRPPSPGKRPPKIYFAAQVAVQPPTILLSVNDPALFREDYRRYLEHHFRESLEFPEVPIRLILRMHHEDRARQDRRARRRGPRPAGR